MERKNLQIEVKEFDAGTGVFSGFASTSDLDRGNDIIVKGAFSRTLSERGDRVKILWQHDMDKPIGKPLQLKETEGGLFIEGKLSDTERGREALTLLKDGVIDSMSIGYSVKEADYNEDGVRVIRDLDLFEVSLVTFPMNEQARVTAVKSVDVRTVEKVLRDAGYSRSQAKAIAGAGVKSLREADEQQAKDEAMTEEVKTALNELLNKMKGI